MATLNRAWENLLEGWQALRERAGQAITRFTPLPRGNVQTGEDQVALHSSRWGLLAADLREDDDGITVRIEAPGMEQNDFEINVLERRVLVVRGEKRVQREESRGQYHLLETAYGRFERHIPLPTEVEEARASASYKKGVLRIVLPKARNAGRRRINVQVD
jgi:HSP20 family protein